MRLHRPHGQHHLKRKHRICWQLSRIQKAGFPFSYPKGKQRRLVGRSMLLMGVFVPGRAQNLLCRSVPQCLRKNIHSHAFWRDNSRRRHRLHQRHRCKWLTQLTWSQASSASYRTLTPKVRRLNLQVVNEPGPKSSFQTFSSRMVNHTG